ncbi:hypothetical protein QVD17_05853 [Tagetes erecta]|uniref:Bifunctional inhibitor/plant lipid transfer protein/seed storage helical domain-containing protein n=1 Tax=Tagetes erecta TaxID=13708 RepID=A0AAD8PAV3_TARER|nr:hypothetical protein QVD17_05853 [Tagetes erecta]
MGVLLMVSVLTEASTKTIVTTTFEQKPQKASGDCYTQVMRHGVLNQCALYLIDTVKEVEISKGSGRIMKSAEEQKQLCCMELIKLQEVVDEECMCLGITITVLSDPVWTKLSDMINEAMTIAKTLPTQCKLSSHPINPKTSSRNLYI